MTAAESARDRAARAAQLVEIAEHIRDAIRHDHEYQSRLDREVILDLGESCRQLRALAAEYQGESLAEDDSPWGSANLTSCGGPCCRGVPAGRDFRDYAPDGERAWCGCWADDPDCECVNDTPKAFEGSGPSDDCPVLSDLLGIIAQAPDEAKLNELWEVHNVIWTDEHTEAAKARMAVLNHQALAPTQDTALAVLRELVALTLTEEIER